MAVAATPLKCQVGAILPEAIGVPAITDTKYGMATNVLAQKPSEYIKKNALPPFTFM